MKLLVAVGEVAADSVEVPPGVQLLVESASEVLVMSPSLVSRLQWLTGEVDRARQVAAERVAAVLDRLESSGVSASGTLGDESPMTAFADAINDFAPDHIVLAFAASPERAWQRHDLVDHLLAEYALPITVFVTRSEPPT